MKTMAVRLEDEQHAQLAMIAQLEELTVADAIRQAIESWIDARRSNPQLQQRAEAVLAEIEREASTRRGAIEALLAGETPPNPDASGAAAGPSSRSSRTRGGPATR